LNGRPPNLESRNPFRAAAELSLVDVPRGPITFSFTGTIEQFTVPDRVTQIRIEAAGAEGGATTLLPQPPGYGIQPEHGGPGRGAQVRGDFAVVAGQVLDVLVGGQPALTGQTGGGGGGTFVWMHDTKVLLIAAGGGGGGTVFDAWTSNGIDGVITEDGTPANGRPEGGGVGGHGATAPSDHVAYAGGGAGWYSDGNDGIYPYGCSNSGGGKSPLSGGTGGAAGGFSSVSAGGFGGGGGGQGRCDALGAGGGGGYSGGGGGFEVPDSAPPSAQMNGSGTFAGGGGGGSFNAGAHPSGEPGANQGHGHVQIAFEW
jgi:hypothetical protein